MILYEYGTLQIKRKHLTDTGFRIGKNVFLSNDRVGCVINSWHIQFLLIKWYVKKQRHALCKIFFGCEDDIYFAYGIDDKNSNFASIKVSVSDLTGSDPTAIIKREAVIGSSILRSILSSTLKTPYNDQSYYEYLNKYNPKLHDDPMNPSEMDVYKEFADASITKDELFTVEELEKLASVTVK